VEEDLEARALGMLGKKVQVAGRDPAARDENVFRASRVGEEPPHRALLVRDRVPHDRRPASGSTQGGQHRAVGVAQLRRARSRRRGHELVPCDGDGYSRAPAHRQGLGARERG
jgi:hypothetical protein